MSNDVLTPAEVLIRPKQDRPLRILYIEDNQALATVVCTTLAQHGYSVEHFPLGNQGFECFRADPQSWDAAIIDLDLPDIPGQTLIPPIAALRPNLPIVVFSGMKGLQDSFELYTSGASVLLSKPFGGTFLLDVLKGLMKIRALSQIQTLSECEEASRQIEGK